MSLTDVQAWRLVHDRQKHSSAKPRKRNGMMKATA